MNVSEYSQPIKPFEYQSPAPIQMMMGVMDHKSQVFERNAQQIQSRIDLLGNQDVVRDVDKAYLNQKVNSLVSRINSFGGQDLSDPGISGELMGLSKTVSADPNVLNAISSTQKFRALQAGWKKIEEDPKETFSQSHYDWDMQQANQWLTDKTPGKTYTGPTVPTRYIDYRKQIDDYVSKIKDNAVPVITDKGTMYQVDNHKTVTEKQIYDAAQMALTPDAQKSMYIDGWEQYRNMDNESLAKTYNQSMFPQLIEQQNIISNLKAKAGLENDITAKKAITDQVAAEEKKLTDMNAQVHLANPQNVAANRPQYEYDLCKNNVLKGFADMYAHDEHTVSWHDIPDDKSGSSLKTKIDPLTGLPIGTPMLSGMTVMPSTGKTEYSEKTLTDDIASHYSKVNDYIQDYIRMLAAKHPELIESVKDSQGNNLPISSAGSSTGYQYKLKDSAQPYIVAGLADAAGRIDDLGNIVNAVNKGTDHLPPAIHNLYAKVAAAINAKAKGQPADILDLPAGTDYLINNVQMELGLAKAKETRLNSIKETAMQQAGFTPEERAFMEANEDHFEGLDKMGELQPNDQGGHFGRNMAVLGKQIQFSLEHGRKPTTEEAIQLENEYRNELAQQHPFNSNVNPQDYMGLLANYQALADKYHTYVNTRNSLYDQQAQALNYEMGTINQLVVKKYDIASRASAELANHSYYKDGNMDSPMSGAAIPSRDISDLRVGKKLINGVQQTVLMGTVKGDSKHPSWSFTTPVTDKNLLQQLQINDSPYQKVNETMALVDRSPVYKTYSSTSTIVPFEIVKNLGYAQDERNTNSMLVQIPVYDASGKLQSRLTLQMPVKQPNGTVKMQDYPFDSAAEAYDYMNKLALSMEQYGYRDIFSFLKAMQNNSQNL